MTTNEITLDQVRTAQRSGAENTKELQRQYDRQRTTAINRERYARAHRQWMATQAEITNLKAEIAALALPATSHGRLCVISQRDAEFIMMSAAVAGGWVAVTLPLSDPRTYVALLYESSNLGFAISPQRARQEMLEACIDADDYRNVLQKLRALI